MIKSKLTKKIHIAGLKQLPGRKPRDAKIHNSMRISISGRTYYLLPILEGQLQQTPAISSLSPGVICRQHIDYALVYVQALYVRE